MRLYLAGPLFTYGEQHQNHALALSLAVYGYDCFLPQDQEANVRAKSAKDIWLTDVAGVDWCDVIVACMDGADPDSGTCWELGYGYATGKKAVLYRSDFRSGCGDFDGQPVNLMMTVPAIAFVHYKGKRMAELAALLHDHLRLITP